MTEPASEYRTNSGTNLTDLDDRELKAVRMCLAYAEDPFGMPSHLLMLIVAKLWRRLEQLLALWGECERTNPVSSQPGSSGDHPEPKENSCFD